MKGSQARQRGRSWSFRERVMGALLRRARPSWEGPCRVREAGAGARSNRRDTDPGRSPRGRLRPHLHRLPPRGSSSRACRSARSSSPTRRGGSSTGSDSALCRLPAVLEHQPGIGAKARYQARRRVRRRHPLLVRRRPGSVAPVAVQLPREGENRERYLGVKIPPSDLESDYGEPAQLFAKRPGGSPPRRGRACGEARRPNIPPA
jgi:hypothetical protein